MGKIERKRITQTRAQLDFLFRPEDVFEVWMHGVSVNKHNLWSNAFSTTGMIHGYFSDKNKAAAAIQQAEKEVKPTGIFLTVNPCKKELIARANHRFIPVKTRTADQDIERIENFFIDLDPKRPTGTSSSNEQLESARLVSLRVLEEIKGAGPCMYAMSGNGWHITLKAGGATSEDIKQILAILAGKFTSELVDVDLTVYNPARLVKVYGTTARKGDQVPEMDIVHRVAYIEEVLDV